MNARRILFATLAASPLLIAFTLPGEKVRFAPGEGTSATKTFVSKVEMTLDKLEMSVNGQEGGAPEIEMSMTQDQTILVTDEYVKMGEGQPKALKRTFDKLTSTGEMSMKMEMMGQKQDNDQTITAKTELDGKTVSFTWDAEAKEYKKAFDPEEDKPKLLAGLFEDMDLRALLPEGEVKKGESWAVDSKSLITILAPGGDLAFKPESSEESQDLGMGMGLSSMNDYLGDLLEGECKASLDDIVEADGKRLAVISITLKIESAKDMSELVRAAMAERGGPEGIEMEFERMDVELKVEAKGELRWNLGANCFESFELSGPMSMKLDQAMSISMGGQDTKIEQHIEMSGTNSLSARRK